MNAPEQNSRFIKKEAERLGFMACGISEATFLEDEAPRLEQWLNEGRHGSMQYMENHFDKRLDPRILVPGARSVVSLLFNYYQETQQRENAPKVSKYAYGEDYHFVVKDRLKELLAGIREEIGAVEGRCFVDSAPVLDKAWAARSGLGWVGKHSNLLSKQKGSFFFIAELIIDMDLAYDRPTTDHCGNCTACIDACPTNAIIEPYVVDGSRCISYFTIELKESIPSEFKGQMADWVFGCDICQDVCPWNRFSKRHNEPRFELREEIRSWSRSDWEEITEDVFKDAFRKSPIKRTGFEGIKRNLAFLQTPDEDQTT
ncbi:MAG: tRNA epoxyqueuosine(34) reductase QueG [Flavobacteriales bacterium]|nr:tRNA epoxyqueuosine(34) reductase QueG [Flavobacteriales bacterium]